ncbi:uncharacterized protein At4g04775-like [Nicotiana sylvestris]|uniref:uncharacterized protein At4g04775-like n=1 Tax=Nicotiana sylvestris TaxID=4096 RepID=UPI00388CDFA0
MSDSIATSKRIYHSGEIAKNFKSTTAQNPGRRFYKCAKPENESCRFWEWQDEAYPDRALIKINKLQCKLDAANVTINMLNQLLETYKVERDKLLEKVDVLEAVKNIEVNKAREIKEKLLKMKMFVLISFALFAGFVAAMMMK